MSRFIYTVKLMAVALCGVLIVSCEEEQTSLGTNLFDPLTFESEQFEITSYNVKLDAVETNDLPVNLIGYYKDPVKYGENADQSIATTYSVMSQVTLQSTSPSFDTDPVLDSVVLTLPYFSTLTSDTTVSEEDRTYELDSVFGNSPINLSVYKSEYYLADLDVDSDFEDELNFFSDINEISDFVGNAKGELLYDFDTFIPSNSQVQLVTFRDSLDVNGDEVLDDLTDEPIQVREEEYRSPRLRVKLPIAIFQQAIIDKEGEAPLSSNTNFRNFFKGIYFEAGAINAEEGSLIAFDFSNADAGIELFYRSSSLVTTTDDDGVLVEENVEFENTFKLSFRDVGNVANSVNVMNNSQEIVLTENDQNDTDGAEYLYLKGGQGNMAVVEIDEFIIDKIQEENWLVNEANLEFYVREDAVSNPDDDAPRRIFIYDLVGETVLADFFIDQENIQFPTVSKIQHLGPLDVSDSGAMYTIKITEYIKSLVSAKEDGEEPENLVLGITVAQNVNVSTRSQVKVSEENEALVPTIPTTSVISHQGVVLYGNNYPDVDKRLRLRIFYTDPN